MLSLAEPRERLGASSESAKTQTQAGKAQASHSFPWGAGAPGAGAGPLRKVRQPLPPGPALRVPIGGSREIRIQAIFSLVPPTVSHQGKQKSGVLSIYFSL